MGMPPQIQELINSKMGIAPVPEAADEEEDDTLVLRKLKPKIPDHNDAHLVAENMKLRKDAGLR